MVSHMPVTANLSKELAGVEVMETEGEPDAIIQVDTVPENSELRN